MRSAVSSDRATATLEEHRPRPTGARAYCIRCREEFDFELAGERHAIDAASEGVADRPIHRPTKMRDRTDVEVGLMESGIDIRDAMAMVDTYTQLHLERTLAADPPAVWVPFGAGLTGTGEPHILFWSKGWLLSQRSVP